MSVKAELFGDSDFIQVRAALIADVGAVEAIVLSRIHFRTDAKFRDSYERDGHRWWRAPVASLAEDTGLTDKQVRRAFDHLREEGYLIAEQHQLEGSYDRAYSVRVNLDEGTPKTSTDLPSRANEHLPSWANVPSIKKDKNVGAKTSKAKKPETPLPEDWQPSAAHRQWAKDQSLDLDLEAMKFRSHAEANDRRQRSWDAAFRMWLANAVSFRKERVGEHAAPKVKRTPTVENPFDEHGKLHVLPGYRAVYDDVTGRFLRLEPREKK